MDKKYLHVAIDIQDEQGNSLKGHYDNAFRTPLADGVEVDQALLIHIIMLLHIKVQYMSKNEPLVPLFPVYPVRVPVEQPDNKSGKYKLLFWQSDYYRCLLQELPPNEIPQDNTEHLV